MNSQQPNKETESAHPYTKYDAIMDTTLYAASTPYTVERNQTKTVNDKMNSSINSTLEDTTPSDSGVQLLDSDASELMVESITSQMGFDFEATAAATATVVQPIAVKEISPIVVDTNFNVTEAQTKNDRANVEEAMNISTCSTFDNTENIVYRRKVRKTPINNKTPKKRVSFHEDILKNTRTDNIHIEHGFVTYKNGRKLQTQIGSAGRYSWCSEREGRSRQTNHTEISAVGEQEQQLDNASAEGNMRRVVYRNACSDVLDYGNSDVYDTNEGNMLHYDNSGVFEYLPKENKAGNQELYNCSSSSSNSSLDSDEQEKNDNYVGQTKSSSWDCIGANNVNNNNFIDENCYFSEPNMMENLNEMQVRKKSVWNKEIKPKSSCLKKTKYNTHIIQEHDLSRNVKKFNVHDMNQLLDNSSKMIIGSLKSLFTIALPERGVPEGSEDLQAVAECIPECTPEHKAVQNTYSTTQPTTTVFAKNTTTPSPTLKAKPFLSKSLDGSKQTSGAKRFVHNVDEQLRRKNDEQMFASTRENSAEKAAAEAVSSCNVEQLTAAQFITNERSLCRQDEVEIDESSAIQQLWHDTKAFRNKFIINCESTVFEHTGVSYCYETTNDVNTYNALLQEQSEDLALTSEIEESSAIAASTDSVSAGFMPAPIAKTFTKFLSSFKTLSPPASHDDIKLQMQQSQQQQRTDAYFALKMHNKQSAAVDNINGTMIINKQSQEKQQNHAVKSVTNTSGSLILAPEIRTNIEKQSRHLPSPLKKRASGSNFVNPQRYDNASSRSITNSSGVGLGSELSSLLSPESSSLNYNVARDGSGRDSKSTMLSEEFDDVLTITTDADKNESDIVIIDYNDCNDAGISSDMAGVTPSFGNLLKPPQAPASKTSLINRFLRNVTQKKLLDSTIRRNSYFAQKLRSEQKIVSNNLYVRGMKPKNYELIDDLNAEIAMEIEMSGVNSPRRELSYIVDSELPGDMTQFDMGIGEISIDIFNGNHVHILRDASEQLFKVFKLYTGYSREGYMTPVLVLLTDKALYVADFVRNCLCAKFVLPFEDLDVILMSPFGNTVLLSNSERDMQQVLLAGGPYPAAGLVANLELCVRRSALRLPAVGQLTLAHLAPLQAFVREHSCVSREDMWMYYAVVQVPANTLGSDKEPLGPHIKGFLMHRRVRVNGTPKQSWNPGYFLLKAGVLYMFNDSAQKLPSWATALAECQGARRAVTVGRPHCFEIMLRGEMLQLAAPDEYVASEWLQALLQTASGLFEMQEKHKTLGCSLVMTEHHLITLREDFSAPLMKFNKNEIIGTDFNGKIDKTTHLAGSYSTGDVGSVLSSAVSTPTRMTQISQSSLNSTPTKLSQISRSTTTCGSTFNSNHIASSSFTTTPITSTAANNLLKTGNSHMSSIYGKGAGLEILSCADIKEMTGIKIPSHNDTWWCLLEFSCQEVRECSDDLIIFFASSSEMQRFLRLLEQLWQAKNNDLFPITVLDEDDILAEQCSLLYMDINRSWEPLLSAALGYPI